MPASRRAFLSSLLGAATPQRPNILWLSCEDMSPDLGCYGDRWAHTPHIDRLAGQGRRFTNAFSVAGVCAPSRSGIITCMYPSSIGTHHMRSQGVPPAYVKCFPEYLRRAGYYCTNNAKTDYNLGQPGQQQSVPLTAWDESGPRAHYRNRPPGASFFAVFNHERSHEGRIRGQADSKEALASVPRQHRHDPARASLPPYYADTPVIRQDWATYYDLVSAVDLQIGEKLRQLDQEGLAENTVVFFWGDHGRGLPRAKRWIYDSGVRVPLIVRWPGRLNASASDELVSLIDLGPTVLSVAGLPVPSYMQGRPFLGERKARPRPYVFLARDRMDETYDMMRGVRDKRYKYIRNYQPEKPYTQRIAYMDEMPTMKELRRLDAEGKLQGPQKLWFRAAKPGEELYDTAQDPHEVRNLAESPKHRPLLARMRRVHQQWMKDIADLGEAPEPQLQQRWRPGGKWLATAAPVITPAGGRFPGPVKARLECPTDGASITYTTDAGERPHWKLYHRELTLTPPARLRARACRLGFQDSPEVAAEFAGS